MNDKKIKNFEVVAIIVAGGIGSRMGADIPKQFLTIGGKTSLELSVEAFLSHPEIDHVCIVIHPDWVDHLHSLFTFNDTLSYCLGGKERYDSVYNGLDQIAQHRPNLVLIHDAARSFVSHSLISDVITALQHEKAVLPVTPVIDTLKKHREGYIEQTVNRDHYAGAQTPQGFHFDTIFALHKEQQSHRHSITDDVYLCEQANIPVKAITGETTNKKLTTQDDMMYANATLSTPSTLRIGSGFDVHAFDGGDKDHVILGGVKIPHHEGLKGHSDADVVLHAIVDAILSALGKGDIGTFFPPSDPQWKGADSSIFIEHAYNLLKKQRGEIQNLTVTIMGESPKIGPHRDSIAQSIAKLLSLDISQINIAATTTEKLGFLGRKEGLAAQATILLSLGRT